VVTLRIRQAAEPDGRHRVDLDLDEAGGADGWGARRSAMTRFAFTVASTDRERLRWYFEDYLDYPADPAPAVARDVETTMTALGVALFKAVFHSGDDARDLWATIRDRLPSLRVGAAALGAAAGPEDGGAAGLRRGGVRADPHTGGPAAGAVRVRSLQFVCGTGGAVRSRIWHGRWHRLGEPSRASRRLGHHDAIAASLTVGILWVAVAACGSKGTAGSGVVIGAQGGIARSADGQVAVGLPAANGTESRVSFGAAPEAANTPIEYASAVGPALNVVVDHPRPRCVVRFRFDPARDLPPAKPDGTRPTTANAFIAIFSDALRMWVPLRTTFDSHTGELVAEAPHFSLFRKFVVNPGRTAMHWGGKVVTVVATTVTSGVEMVVEATKALLSVVAEDLTGTIPDERKAACPPDAEAVPTIVTTVAGASNDIKACVVKDQGKRWLRIQNGLGIPFDAYATGRLDIGLNEYDKRALDDVLYLLFMAGDVAVKAKFVPALSSVEVGLPPDGDVSGTVVLRANLLGVAADFVLGMLSILTPEKVIQDDITYNGKILIDSLQAAIGTGTTREANARITTDRLKVRLAPERVERLTDILDAYNCLLSFPVQVTARSVLEGASRCGGAILRSAGHELAGALLSALSLVRLPNEFVDLLRHGNRTTTIRVAPTPPDNGDGPAATGLNGEYYANATDIDVARSVVTFDVVQWFWGEEATRACRQDGVEIGDYEWCNDYYIRNRSNVLRIMSVAPDATMTDIDTNAAPPTDRPAILADLAADRERSGLLRVRLTVRSNVITEIHQVFTP
jgi:hypothetical protein